MGDKRQLNGLYFGGWGDYQLWADHDFQPRETVAEPEPALPPAVETEPVYVAPPVRQPAIEIIDESDPRPLVRPYTRTGGRTKPVHALELETLLSFSPAWQVDMHTLRADHRAICSACETPQSTAELAVHLGLPLGAARVLIADVVELGLIHVHELELVGSRPSMDLLERVHAGLLRL
ncbi:hypothetical protein JOF56_007171 [Kibdelosporangium banguiense]|uniref:DUF742 domain-containing protein n=1 Tax=Kibdelosporangium banguiense TaxID=1365924 RepID=A0ABS4TSB7_9PSEU|nr:DUF742 domain-containing protein [Kibdelosporangium banguiense]MBP2326786.1 hypothetical protein [Kibdelosporangium banguiense]